MKAYLPGLIIIFVGIVLFWASGRPRVSRTAAIFLEGQATVCIPAGLAALGVGAWSKTIHRNGNGNGK